MDLIAIELMIVLTCEKCKTAKKRWVSALDLISAASRIVLQSRKSLVKIVLETEDGSEVSSLPLFGDVGSDLSKFERELEETTSKFSQLLWKYNLMRGKLLFLCRNFN